MRCPQCGYTLAPTETFCPRCAQGSTPTGTRRLEEMQTRHLVQLDRCERCQWFLFPADTVCSACGAPVRRPWQTPTQKRSARPRLLAGKYLGPGLAMSALTLCLLAILWYVLYH